MKNILRVNGQGSHWLCAVRGGGIIHIEGWLVSLREGGRRKCLADIGSSPKLYVRAAGRGEVGRVLTALGA